MKIVIMTTLLFPCWLLAQSSSQYESITLSEDSPTSAIRDQQVQEKVQNNCNVLVSETSWNADLNSYNNDQCILYSGYTDFSREHLSWIDDIKLIPVMDETTGMEVQEVRFFSEGEETNPTSFLSSRLDACKGEDKKQTVKACVTHFGALSLKMKPIMESAKGLSTQSDDLVKGTADELRQEVESLKSSRKPSDIKRIKDLKSKLKSVEQTGDLSSTILPGLIKLMAEDYQKIDGVSKTLKRLEEGL
jgi:hypothetical protein